MKTRSRSTRRALPVVVALSATLVVAACGSDDDDDDSTGDTTAGQADAGGTDAGGTDAGGTDAGGGDDSGGDDSGAGGTEGSLDVSLSTDEEVPPLATPAPDATGSGSVTVGEDGAIGGQITVEGLTGRATMAHIHRGFPGNTGPVAIGLEGNDDGTVWTIPDGSSLTDTMIGDVSDAFARGELYFNVHTEANQAGELRGQIVPTGDAAPTAFTVRIANVSTDETLPTSTGSVAVPLSPGAYVVHRGDMSPLLEPRDPASEPLEMVAEDGDPSGFPGLVSGATVFNTPVDAEEPGPIGPGGAYELSFTAVPGDKLSFVTMFIQSNDWFYTPTDDDDSIALFGEDGTPTSGDVSDQIGLWDSGTEQDEEPGTGANQAPRQAGPDTGPEEGATVGSLESQGKSVTLNGSVIEVTVTPATAE